MQRDAPHGRVQTIADRKWHKQLTPHQKQTSGAEWARMRATGSTSTRGSEVEGKTFLAKTWLMEVERRDLKCITPRLVQASLVANARRMRFLVIENGMTRNEISASTFPGHPRCNSIPSCWVSMLRGVRFCSSLHLLSKLAARGSLRKDNNVYPVWGDDIIWKMSGQLCSRNVDLQMSIRTSFL